MNRRSTTELLTIYGLIRLLNWRFLNFHFFSLTFLSWKLHQFTFHLLDDEEDEKMTTTILRHIELIDDEASEYGIRIVKSNDDLMAKKFGYRSRPGITYFRKGLENLIECFRKNYSKQISGKPINYDGDIDDEEEILDWLTNPENMEMTDSIERANRKMFEKIRKASDYLAVFFCKLG